MAAPRRRAIRDMSDRGARIIISHALNVPDAVELYVMQTAKKMRARVEWRRDDELVLSFAENGDGTNASKELVARLVRLEIEVASLRHTIKELSDDSVSEFFDGAPRRRRMATLRLVSLPSGDKD